MMKNYIVRHAVIEDLDEISELELLCFPKEEAATKEIFYSRLKNYPECFWLLIADDKLISMVNGMTSNSTILSDEMYNDSSMYDSMGEWQMIFGVETRPEYQGRGYADLLLRMVISDVKNQNRKGIILTCKSELIPYYEKFGFLCEGMSVSKHGGASWYQMKIIF